MPLPITHFYEVVDTTDDETYFAMGYYIDEKAALESLDVAEPPRDDNGEDSAVMEVRKRPLGWHPHEYTTIAKRTWLRQWPEEEGPSYWECKPPLGQTTVS